MTGLQSFSNQRNRFRVKLPTDDELWALRSRGMTLQAIADLTGVSRQRVHQALGNTGRRSGWAACRLSKIFRRDRNEIKDILEQAGFPPLPGGRHAIYPYDLETLAPILRRVCKIKGCGKPVPLERTRYCSKECYLQSLSYANRSEAERAKQRERVRNYYTKMKLERGKRARSAVAE